MVLPLQGASGDGGWDRDWRASQEPLSFSVAVLLEHWILLAELSENVLFRNDRCVDSGGEWGKNPKNLKIYIFDKEKVF